MSFFRVLVQKSLENSSGLTRYTPFRCKHVIYKVYHYVVMPVMLMFYLFILKYNSRRKDIVCKSYSIHKGLIIILFNVQVSCSTPCMTNMCCCYVSLFLFLVNPAFPRGQDFSPACVLYLRNQIMQIQGLICTSFSVINN
jgi:hypothetical protein